MNLSEKILVTGANGLLGTNTIIHLLNQGHYVVGFLRDKKKYFGGSHKNLELVEGDLMNADDLMTVCSRCKYIVHTAALTSQDILNYSSYKRINVFGLRNVVEAAINNNVKKIVYVSSANVFGYGDLKNLGDETKEMAHPFTKSFYAKSKKESQEFILSKKNHLDIVIVNPTFMIGAYDAKPTSGKIVQMGLNKKIVFCPPGGKNFVCVEDVAIGISKALVKGVNGQSYLLANKNMTYWEFFDLLRKQTEKHFIIIKVPEVFLLILGYVGNGLKWMGLKTSFSFANMKALCLKCYYSNSKATNDLKLAFSPLEKGIIEAIDWFNRKSQ